MLLSILRDGPEAVYVAWDAPGPTFRDEAFADYKAHRPEVDPDLKAQFGLVRRMVEAFEIAAVEEPGFEADDSVGALAVAGVEDGFDVVIYTGDSDQLQLVGDGVTVRMTTRGVSETADYDARAVYEKYGVRPDQFADYKALVGDSSDNIPGVPGVGKVTAARLLQEWQDLDSLLAGVGRLPEKTATERKVKAALTESADRARLAQSLTRIRCDAPVSRPLRRYAPTEATWQAVRGLFAELEFRSLAQRLPSTGEVQEPPAPEQPAQVTWSVVPSADALLALIEAARNSGSAAVRLRTDDGGPLKAQWVGLAVATCPSAAWYVPIRGQDRPRELVPAPDDDGASFAAEPADLAPLLAAPDIALSGHDVKRSLIVLNRHGLGNAAFVMDTALAAYLLRPGSADLSLSAVADRYLGQSPPESADAREKACREAACIAALAPVLVKGIEAAGLDVVLRRVEVPLTPVLAGIEATGILLDREWLRNLSADMRRRIESIAEEVFALAGERFLISSTQQLQRVLFDKLGLPAGKRIKTGRTTSADHLEALAAVHPIARLVLDYREVSKLKSTYADALPPLADPVTGRLHTTLHQMVTSTGRLASSDPNLQNIPVRSEEGRRIRRAFVAPHGSLLVSCDYSQIELRVFAHVTQDPGLMRAFEAGEDIHAATATRLFGVSLDGVTPDMRRRAKTVNFAVIYGQSAFGLAQALGIPVDEARAFIASYFGQFPGVRRWTDGILAEARERGYVQTLMGRRRYLPELRAGNRNVREGAERAAVNMPIQGAAADIMKLAMLAVWDDIVRNSRPWRLILQVHDELLLETPEAEAANAAATVVGLMEGALELSVPLGVEAKAGPNWADMQGLRVT